VELKIRRFTMTPLSGKRVKIRPLEQEDWKDLYRWWNNPASLGEFIRSPLQSYKEFEKFLENVVFAQHQSTILIIERVGDTSKVGDISFWPSREGDYGITIGYALGEADQRSKGFMTEAVKLLVDYLFESKNIERIDADTDLENVGSQKVLERNGFKKEGVLRKHSYVKGEFRDDYQYSLIREDWKANKKTGN
jgi:[ribosomal protein S5]-alanine N-acetyltransferase